MKKLIWIITTIVVMNIITGCNARESVKELPAAESEEATETKEQLSDYPRTIKHERGEVILEKKPQRIASLDVTITDYLLILDEAPIMSTSMSLKESSEKFAEFAEGKEIIDMGGRFNMEMLVEKNPDIMLVSSVKGVASRYEQFNKVADTIVIDYSVDAPSRLRAIAKIVGKEEKAEEFIDDYDKKVSEAKEVAKNYKNETFLFLVSNGKDFTVMHPNEFPVYFENIGLTAVDGLPDQDNGRIGIEALNKLNPDHIFIAENRRDADGDNLIGLIDVWQNNQVWKGLKAVEKNQVYPVDPLVSDTFFLGELAGVEAILENLDK